MTVRMELRNFHDRWVRQVVVVVVRDDYRVDCGNVFDLAGHFGVALWAEPRQWRASVCKDGIEEDTQSGRKFDIVAGMAQPGRSQRCVPCSCWEEGRRMNRDCWWSSVWLIPFAGEPSCEQTGNNAPDGMHVPGGPWVVEAAARDMPCFGLCDLVVGSGAGGRRDSDAGSIQESGGGRGGGHGAEAGRLIEWAVSGGGWSFGKGKEGAEERAHEGMRERLKRGRCEKFIRLIWTWLCMLPCSMLKDGGLIEGDFV